jgi:antagonist of KipI
MNSCSTFLPTKIGGYEGRTLKGGDQISVGEETAAPVRRLRADVAATLQPRGPIRVTASLQRDWFNQETFEGFQQQGFTVREDSNRSGLRLQGVPIMPTSRRELLTEGIALGAIQVPPDGQPIILFVDQQTTGGYPKIANVIAADLPRVGQLRPRDQVKFQFVGISEAIELLRWREKALGEAFAS